MSHAASTMLLATIADRTDSLNFPDFIVWTSSYILVMKALLPLE
jgi:hypothetical protein